MAEPHRRVRAHPDGLLHRKILRISPWREPSHVRQNRLQRGDGGCRIRDEKVRKVVLIGADMQGLQARATKSDQRSLHFHHPGPTARNQHLLFVGVCRHKTQALGPNYEVTEREAPPVPAGREAAVGPAQTDRIGRMKPAVHQQVTQPQRIGAFEA